MVAVIFSTEIPMSGKLLQSSAAVAGSSTSLFSTCTSKERSIKRSQYKKKNAANTQHRDIILQQEAT